MSLVGNTRTYCTYMSIEWDDSDVIELLAKNCV